MQPKTKVRLAALSSWFIMVGGWFFISYSTFQDYISLLNHEYVVMFSPIVLWFPVGGFGALLYVICIVPKVIFTGKKIPQIISPRTASRWNKIMLGFIFIGIAFATGGTYHTFELMDKYGYVYSDELNKNTGTSIYRKWVRSM